MKDLDQARDFYVRILGFEIESADARGYTRLSHGSAAIALNPVARIPKSHPARQKPDDRVGKGHEINLLVENIEQVFERVQSAGGEIREPLTNRPWGSKDFCLEDPDGNFIRITN